MVHTQGKAPCFVFEATCIFSEAQNVADTGKLPELTAPTSRFRPTQRAFRECLLRAG